MQQGRSDMQQDWDVYYALTNPHYVFGATSQVLALATHGILTQNKIHQYVLTEESVDQLPTTS
jgi:hypothetical protein